MKRFFGVALVLGAMLLWGPSTAQAITIGPTCGTCGSHGTQFDISFALVDGGTNTYDVTITATYVTPPADLNITALGINIDGVQVDNFVSVTGPDGQTWSKVLGSLNQSTGNGCAGNPGSAFACTDASPGAAPPGPDTWVLRLDFDKALNLATVSGAFKVRFTEDGEFSGPLLSEEFAQTTTPTTSPTTATTSPTGAMPEPTSLLLLGSGLVLAHQRLRRRRVKA
jgi:hypothetical protein